VRVQHHPDCSTLMAYASGTLGEALSVVVACHVAWCPSCQRDLRCHEETGGAIIDGIESVPVDDGCLHAVLKKIDACCQGQDGNQASVKRSEEASLGLPRPLCRLLQQPLDAITWRRLAPGIAVHRIDMGPGARGQLMLMRIAGGKALPRHGHHAGELTMVLRGAYHDEVGRFAMGDIADLGNDVEHRPTIDAGNDCICLVGLERPWRFKAFLLRLVQPLMRL